MYSAMNNSNGIYILKTWRIFFDKIIQLSLKISYMYSKKYVVMTQWQRLSVDKWVVFYDNLSNKLHVRMLFLIVNYELFCCDLIIVVQYWK